MNRNRIEKNIIYKIWNTFVILLVFAAIVILIYSYSHVTPEQVESFEIYNLIISLIFLFDLILRCVLFGKFYIFSMDFWIDLLACSDIVSPVLKSLRGLKYLRLTRVLRVLRVLRIFRVLKVLKNIDIKESETKIVTVVSIIIILIFIFVSLSISGYVTEKIGDIIYENYDKTVTNINFRVINNNTFFETTFKNEIKNRIKISNQKNFDIDIAYYKLANALDRHYIINRNDIEKTYFKEDKYLFITENYEILFVNKNKRFYGNIIEMLIIFISLPTLIMLIFVLNYFINDCYWKPLVVINDSIERVIDTNFKELVDMEFEEPELNTLIEQINKLVKKINPKIKDEK